MPVEFVINFAPGKDSFANIKVNEISVIPLGVGVEIVENMDKEAIRNGIENAIKKAIFEAMGRCENINSNALLNIKIDYKVFPLNNRIVISAIAYGTASVVST